MPAGSSSPYLDAAITSRASPSSQMAGIIKSIQRGTITISAPNLTADATISAVNAARAFVVQSMVTGSTGANGYLFGERVNLLNGTTVRATREWYNGSDTQRVDYQVVEFY